MDLIRQSVDMDCELSCVVSDTPDQEVRRYLHKILASEVFSGSVRMSRFLRFTVEEALSGNSGQLKEIVIADRVFDRGNDFDPRLDPIVRVEARRLRNKLNIYYESVGVNDSVRFGLPKGRYAPVFTRHLDDNSSFLRTGAGLSSTIAVLPFVLLSPGRGTAQFSEGLREELIYALTGIACFRVAAWTSGIPLHQPEAQTGEVARRLDVAYILRGSIRRTGQMLRVAVHLIETLTGHYIWSEIYDRQLGESVFSQGEIATTIASSLKLLVAGPTNGRPFTSTHREVEALQLCLRGRFHARDRTTEGLKRSLAFFERALLVCGDFAPAYAGLADTHALLAEYQFADGCDAMYKAKSAAQKALELDPHCAEAHASLGLITALYDWSWEASGKAFERAIVINPGYAPAHYWYSLNHLAMLGQLSEAGRELDRALKLDPLSSTMRCSQAYLRLLNRQYGEAIEIAAEIANADPSFSQSYAVMGRAYIQSGLYKKSIEMLQEARTLAGDSPTILAALGQAYALAGESFNADQQLAMLHSIAARRPVAGSCFALVHLGSGNKDAALTWLERGVARHQSSMISLGVHPAFDELRQEDRFQKLLGLVGLPTPNRQRGSLQNSLR